MQSDDVAKGRDQRAVSLGCLYPVHPCAQRFSLTTWDTGFGEASFDEIEFRVEPDAREFSHTLPRVLKLHAAFP